MSADKFVWSRFRSAALGALLMAAGIAAVYTILTQSRYGFEVAFWSLIIFTFASLPDWFGRRT